jgi:putative oxidoreductase
MEEQAMSTGFVSQRLGTVTPERLRATEPHRHLLLVRIAAGLPLLATGLAHVLVPEAPLRPLVDAAGFPFAAVITPIGIVVKIVAGILLLLGLWARLGGMVGVPIMLAALYAHAVIDVWPNAPEVQEPPLALPITVLIASGYVLWRGAGCFSLDHRHQLREGRS